MTHSEKAKIKSFLEFFFCSPQKEWDGRSEQVLRVIHDPDKFDRIITKFISEFESIAENH